MNLPDHNLKLLVLDTSQIGPLAKAFGTESEQGHVLAILEGIHARGYSLLFSVEHFIEMFQHKDESVVRDRISFIRQIESAAWISRLDDQPGVGAVTSLFSREVKSLLQRPELTIPDMVSEVGCRAFMHGTGVELASMVEQDFEPMRHFSLQLPRQTREIASAVVSKGGNGQRRISDLRGQRFCTEAEAYDRASSAAQIMTGQLSGKGDKRLENPSKLATHFYKSIVRENRHLLHGQHVGIDPVDVLLMQMGFEPGQVDDDTTLYELEQLVIFRGWLSRASNEIGQDCLHLLDKGNRLASWFLWQQLTSLARKSVRAKGSDLIDKQLGLLCLYADVTVVDKRTFEYMKSVGRKEELRNALGKCVKLRSWKDVLGVL